MIAKVHSTIRIVEGSILLTCESIARDVIISMFKEGYILKNVSVITLKNIDDDWEQNHYGMVLLFQLPDIPFNLEYCDGIEDGDGTYKAMSSIHPQ